MNITDEFQMLKNDTTGANVAQGLQNLGDGGVVLVTEAENHVVGYITQRELIDAVAVGINVSTIPASQLMNTDFMEVMEDDTLGNLMPLIARRYPNAIIVINYNLKCVGYFSKNDYRDALAALGYYDQSQLPETPEEWRAKGIAMSAAGHTDEALRCFESSIELYPDKERGWFELARTLESGNRLKDAVLCYDRVVVINPNNDDAWINRGNVYSGLRMHERAVQSYNQALLVNPDNVSALINKGLALSDLGKVDMALKSYNQAQALRGESAEIWFRKGNAFDKVKKFKDAVKCYDKAIKLNSNYEDAWFNKGAALHILGKEKKAIECMEIVLKLNPNNTSAREAIAICKGK
jgi:tetratricopeptide (TPR) repeat protein